MTGTRASVFEDEGLDVSGFAPREKVREVAQQRGFVSRDPAPAPAPPAAPSPPPPRREPRRHRTGRNVQLNLKVRTEDVEAFYALADEMGLVLGEVFERAVAALSRELAAERK